MNAALDDASIKCPTCGTRGQAAILYCSKCGTVLREAKTVEVKRTSQMQSSPTTSRRPIKAAAEHSGWSVLLPLVVVGFPLFIKGPTSLIMSIPIALLCFWWMGKNDLSRM